MIAAASPTIATHTLGCKVNKCDTEALLAKLKAAGFDICEFNQPAGIYIINTCTVTHAGDKKSLQIIRRTRRQNPTAFIAVCGCMPRGQSSSASKINEAGADFIFDARKPDDLLAKLNEMPLVPHAPTQHAGFNTSAATAARTRAFIKIQDGCNRYCSYCIVPYVRGPVVSRPLEEIQDEASTHIKHGAQEIVLTGIQVAAYGYDTGNNITLPVLISHLSSTGIKRLRLSSIDPWAVDDAFMAAVGNSPTLCAHFHLSLQSGSNKTLTNMNRRYTTTDYATAANKLRSLKPNMALTTDIIVGFPGETEEDFKESLSFASEMQFSKIHVFEYSPRTGTPAANMPNQVPSHTKSARSEKMRALASSLEQSFLSSQVGKQMPVLFESKSNESPDIWQGHTENYCLVKVKGTNLANTIKQVKITDTANNSLIGSL